MSTARAVYDGVGGGGDLFEDIKFLVLQRIPERTRWIGIIKDNGGEIVKTEAQANMVIGDHARKDQPPGSISWKWLEASMKKGVLADSEKYHAGPATQQVREAGSKQPPKKGRTPFSAEDDRILMEWCTKAERLGSSISGNTVFQQLAEKNKRHPWQSWRDRWVKHLADKPRPVLPADDEDEEEEPLEISPEVRPPQKKTASRNIASRPRSPQIATSSRGTAEIPAPRPVIARASSVMSRASPVPSLPRSTVSRRSEIFTEEETQRMIDEFDNFMNIREDMMIDTWIAWAEANPTHTAQQWRNYFKEYVVPRMELRKAKGKAKQPASEESNEVSPPTSKHPSKARIVEIQNLQEISSSSPRVCTGKYLFKSCTDEAVFREQLAPMAAHLDINVDYSPIICGRTISLFQLWQVVGSKEFGGVNEVEKKDLWAKVAAKMKFPQDAHVLQQAGEELEETFNIILGDLHDKTSELPDEFDMPSSEIEALLSAQLQETANGNQLQNEDVDEEEHDFDFDSPQGSSRRQGSSPSSKRAYEESHAKSLPTSKRQRIEKGKGKEREIPSTPEVGVNEPQGFPQSQPTPTPLRKSFIVHEGDLFVSSDSDDVQVFASSSKPLWSKSKRSPPTRQRNIEPETQDFHFPASDQDSGDRNISSSPPLPLSKEAVPQSSSKVSNTATRGSVHSSNPNDSSTQSQTDAEKQAELEKFIDHNVSLGYPQEIVVDALMVTTMEIGPHVTQVTEALMNGEPIPDNISGVWTTKDDEALGLGTENREYRRVVAKHNIWRVRQRKEYLKEVSSMGDDG